MELSEKEKDDREVILSVSHIDKHFGATHALNDVSLEFRKGSVHSIVGRNGAGKSTIVNVICGILVPDSGDVVLNGKNINGTSIRERQEMGIRMVTQHASSIMDVSVAENIFVGNWPKSGGRVDWDELNYQAYLQLQEYGLDVPPQIMMSRLSPVDQRKVNIVRALNGGAQLIILDEPTTALSSLERDNLFSFVRRLADQGTAFIFITHYLDEVMRMSDDISVLRDGMSFTGYTKADMDEKKLGDLVAGENIVLFDRRQQESPIEDEVKVSFKNFHNKRIKDMSLDIKKGEVVGFIGFPGSGAREFCRSMFGLYKDTVGETYVSGKKVKIKNPTDAIDRGIVYIPNDRHTEGIVGLLTIMWNISMPIMKSKLQKKLFLDLKNEESIVQKYYDRLAIKANSMHDTVDSLSGGNQQKVVVSKSLASDPALIILDEPTVGIDIKSREEIVHIVDEITRDGSSAIYLTNDFDELLRISDRLVFFENGEIKTIVPNDGLTTEEVIRIRDEK